MQPRNPVPGWPCGGSIPPTGAKASVKCLIMNKIQLSLNLYVFYLVTSKVFANFSGVNKKIINKENKTH